MELIGKINVVNKTVNNQQNLKKYNFEIFDINTCESSCIIESYDGDISISKWVSPKRTRSEPFARVYKTLGQMKSITVIPVIKDEGINGDCDSFNPTTLAWMNLLNVYIILVPYVRATNHLRNSNKITNQEFDNGTVKNAIKEILNFRSDAHHYNNEKFQNNFTKIFNEAIDLYEQIGKKLNVKMHNVKKINYSFDEYLNKKNDLSIKAANREKYTNHKLEYTHHDKGIIEITNFYKGKYFLTVDEVFYEKDDTLILREAKNSTSNFPSLGEILDAFFKCLLFLNIDNLIIKENSKKINFKVEILLTGNNVQSPTVLIPGYSLEKIENLLNSSLLLTNKKLKELSSLFFKYINYTGCIIRIGENK